MITGRSLLRGSLQEDIVDRFQKYFALFDGRQDVDPSHYAMARQVINELFDDSVANGQQCLAKDMLSEQACITVNTIEKCYTGRVFYHLKVCHAKNKSSRQHITGFATINEDSLVTDVETKVKLITFRRPRIGRSGISIQNS